MHESPQGMGLEGARDALHLSPVFFFIFMKFLEKLIPNDTVTPRGWRPLCKILDLSLVGLQLPN